MNKFLKYIVFLNILFYVPFFCLAQSTESSESEKNNEVSANLNESNNNSPKYFVASNILVNGGGFYLDNKNVVGIGVSKASLKVNEDGIDKVHSTGFGLVYGYAFDSFENNTFFVGTTLGYGEIIFETDDGSKYTYSGPSLNIGGGYNWNFGNNLSLAAGIGPSISGLNKQSESNNSSKKYREKVEDRVKKDRFRLLSRIPFLFLYYSF